MLLRCRLCQAIWKPYPPYPMYLWKACTTLVVISSLWGLQPLLWKWERQAVKEDIALLHLRFLSYGFVKSIVEWSLMLIGLPILHLPLLCYSLVFFVMWLLSYISYVLLRLSWAVFWLLSRKKQDYLFTKYRQPVWLMCWNLLFEILSQPSNYLGLKIISTPSDIVLEIMTLRATTLIGIVIHYWNM